MVPTGRWYTEALGAVHAQQAGVSDYLNRPWGQHFERVALRLIFRNPNASQDVVTAALLHDVFMDRGGGWPLLNSLGVSRRVVEIIERTTPPPQADYFRKFELIGPDETTLYLDYIRTLVATSDREPVEMKLADITDTIDACRQRATEMLITQLNDRYEPSRVILERALGSSIL